MSKIKFTKTTTLKYGQRINQWTHNNIKTCLYISNTFYNTFWNTCIIICFVLYMFFFLFFYHARLLQRYWNVLIHLNYLYEILKISIIGLENFKCNKHIVDRLAILLNKFPFLHKKSKVSASNKVTLRLEIFKRKW